MKSKQTPLQRVNRIINFNWKRGTNKESVNEVYRKIINYDLFEESKIASLIEAGKYKKEN